MKVCRFIARDLWPLILVADWPFWMATIDGREWCHSVQFIVAWIAAAFIMVFGAGIIWRLATFTLPGAICNGVVVIANAGRMPVERADDYVSGYVSARHCDADGTEPFLVLADLGCFGGASIGDLLLLTGTGVAILAWNIGPGSRREFGQDIYGRLTINTRADVSGEI